MARPRLHLSDNDRKKAWSEKNKDKIKTSDRSRKQVQRAAESQEQKLIRQEKQRSASKGYYQRKKDKLAAQVAKSLEESHLGSYKCKQTLSKALNKVGRALPLSPRKRCAVVLGLLRRDAAEMPTRIPTPKIPWNKTSQATIETVVAFLESDDVSWVSPNIRDCVKTAEVSERKSRRYLICTLLEAYFMFSQKFPNIKVSLSKFCGLRPQHVRTNSYLPEITCLCKYHENFRSLCKSLKPVLPNEGVKDFISKLVCSIQSEACMFGSCDLCANKLTAVQEACGEGHDLDEAAPSFSQWVTTSAQVSKVPIENQSFRDVFIELQEQIHEFKRHMFVQWAQSSSFEQDRESLITDERKCVIQVDFAENYKCAVQDEIQAHHFKGGQQISIFTACAWWSKSEHCAIAGVSDSLEHSKFTVFHLLDKIISRILCDVKTVKDFVFYR